MKPTDERSMRRAIALSRRGYPAPNPHVGCVIERGGEIVGEGFHDYAGGPHAEVVALGQAGERARGATAYVTLEPCRHHGRTPPCVDALIQAGIARVVVAVLDPNPKARGGLHALEQAGLIVESGCLGSEARQANLAWLTAMERRRPYVVVKAAMSLDGRIALPNGHSQWITGEAARREGRRLRAECGAVLVGRRTVEQDDPQLTVRGVRARNQPLRVILDPQRRLAPGRRVFDDQAPTVRIVASPAGPGEMEVKSGPEGFNLAQLLDSLFARGITGLLVEGGAHTLGSFLRARLVDRLELFVGGRVLGEGPGWAVGHFGNEIAAAPGFKVSRIRRRGPDLWLTATPEVPDWKGAR